VIRPGPLEVGLVLSVVVVVGVITGLVIFVVKRSTKKKTSEFEKHDDKYLEIAKERYAKGEISKEEFEDMRKLLE
jgi:putative membrane protein